MKTAYKEFYGTKISFGMPLSEKFITLFMFNKTVMRCFGFFNLGVVGGWETWKYNDMGKGIFIL
jgi:hypothetical protein